MPSPNEKLAESLDVLKELQNGGRRVFRSEDFSRVHRERLVENGFLQEVIKGWLISASPASRAGGTISKPVTREDALSQSGATPMSAKAWARSSPPVRMVALAQRSMTIRFGQSP